MAEKKHLKCIHRGVKNWNQFIEEKWEGAPDLSGANLQRQSFNHIDLRHVDLSNANLSQSMLENSIFIDADLSGADMSGAILTGADMSGANLSDANLSGANLTGANLNETILKRCKLVNANLQRASLNNAQLDAAILIRADLSAANLSGVSITDANISRWIIKNIKCTHIIWKNKRIDFENPDDFEKSFTEIESLVEILLNIPFSDLSYYTGRIIQHEINQKYGEDSLQLKGQTAISDDTTKFEFISFSAPNKLAEIKDKLHELQSQLKPVIEEAILKSQPQSIIGSKSEIDVPFSGGTLVARPKEIKRALQEHHAQMHPLLQSIIQAIQLHLQ